MAQFSRWGLGRRSIPAEQPVVKPARPSSPGGGSAGDPSRLNRVASHRSSLRFGRNTPGIPPSRALSAGPPPGGLAPPGELGLAPTGRTGRPRRSPGFHHRLLTAGGKTHAAFGRRCIPPEPLRCAPLFVAFRSEYTRYSSLTRLVGRAPHRPRRSREFHHRLLAPEAEQGVVEQSPSVEDPFDDLPNGAPATRSVSDEVDAFQHRRVGVGRCGGKPCPPEGR